MKELPALCQALRCASWWSLLGTESCLFLSEGWKFPSKKFMTIAIPIDQRFSCPQHPTRKTLGNPSQPVFWYTYSFHLPSEDNLPFGEFFKSQNYNLRRTKNIVNLEFLCHAAQGWGIPGDRISLCTMHCTTPTDPRLEENPVPYWGSWHVTVWSKWQETI